MRKITTIKKIIFLLIMLIIMVGVHNSVFAFKMQEEEVLGIEKHQGITWTCLEGDKKETKVGEYVRYNPGIQSNNGEIKYCDIIEGRDKVSVNIVNNGQYSYIQIHGKNAGTAKINVYYLPIGNTKYTGIHNYSMKTLTVTVTGTVAESLTQTGNPEENNKTWYEITFLNSKGKNIKNSAQNLILKRQYGDKLRMPLSPQKLKESGFNLNEDISNYGEFEGWKNTKTGNIYKPGTEVTITSNCTFKAQFKEKKVENGKQDSGNKQDSLSSDVKKEEIKVNDSLTFTATSWKLYSDKDTSNVKAYLSSGDKVKVVEVNDTKIPYILKVEVVSANKLKVGNTYYMKYGVSAVGNFKIEKADIKEDENKAIDLLQTLLKIIKATANSTNAGEQSTPVPQDKNEQMITTAVNMIKTFVQLVNTFLINR